VVSSSGVKADVVGTERFISPQRTWKHVAGKYENNGGARERPLSGAAQGAPHAATAATARESYTARGSPPPRRERLARVASRCEKKKWGTRDKPRHSWQIIDLSIRKGGGALSLPALLLLLLLTCRYSTLLYSLLAPLQPAARAAHTSRSILCPKFGFFRFFLTISCHSV